ncbi:uncharacterized protein LOC130736909 [Lotus japonicus]|uniref:uncharacterized protein LOC130736909 n=1 Tax=Lotus japonicus TaxID=34305 RepID=UPI00259037F6|nr:uncharacterized protein LOC130736909 [Lotus japonicus]
MATTQQNDGRNTAPVDASPNVVGTQEAAENAANVRGKTNPAWEHFAFQKEGRSCTYTCLYCGTSYKGGGINRIKHHLAGIPGQISACKKVPPDVRHRMVALLESIEQKKNEAKNNRNEAFGDEAIDEVGHELNACPTVTPASTQSKGKRKATGEIDNYFAPRTTPGSQPTLKSVLSSKEVVHKAKMAIARWFFDACIPFNALQSPYFQPALDAVVAIGSGFKGPSYDELRVNLLGDCKKECQLLVESHRANWAKYGCTIMADGWSDQRQRTLINFMVYCHTSMSFVKSVDGSDIVKDASTLYHLFSEVIEWVGPQNVVHVVTDNAANYVAAGKLLHQKYENIFWTPCAAHCINLILKDIGSLPHIADLASKASKVTIFIYNHMIFLYWLRKRSSWKEIVRPGVTRFATTFITLKSISDHKSDLQALVVNQHFTGHKLSTGTAGKLASEIILDNKFWRYSEVVSNIAAPIIRLLRIVDGDEKPSMGYVYDGMQRAKNTIKRMFRDKSELYKPYTDIISARWDKHLKRTLHAAAYLLNPGFFYDPSFVKKDRVVQSLIDLLEVKSLCASLPKALLEMNVYREREGSFSRASALQAASQIQPGKYLSKLSELKKRTYDPVDYECINNVDFWVVEEEAPPEFDDNEAEFENNIYEDDARDVAGGEEVDIS